MSVVRARTLKVKAKKSWGKKNKGEKEQKCTKKVQNRVLKVREEVARASFELGLQVWTKLKRNPTNQEKYAMMFQ